MITPRVLVDTAIFAYALGGEHPEREPCRRVVAAARDRLIEPHASWDLVQELVFHRLRRTSRTTAVEQARAAAEMLHLHDVDSSVVLRSLDLIMTTDTIRGRDALHAATALEHGITMIVTPDSDFDGVPGLIRVDPSKIESVAQAAG
ncbi:type II toxin-antitoxin system VapC family toxin [Microlunatus parietis]|uniref:Ribonuclease VapC n=1 Tax=Microlunatus parietis TaxID=682979 RepID=A0A7Y9LAE3_9ACTN|nr:type II toxin-antitoxin system VapC family toxin [Microlunatus parietis]NYE69688.1 hypothetical protein [Microlunatus parietis]